MHAALALSAAPQDVLLLQIAAIAVPREQLLALIDCCIVSFLVRRLHWSNAAPTAAAV